MGCTQTFIHDYIRLAIYRSSLLHVFHKIGVLENFAKFTGQHVCWDPFLIKLETPAQVFSKFCLIFKNIFFTEELWQTASNYIFSK